MKAKVRELIELHAYVLIHEEGAQIHQVRLDISAYYFEKFDMLATEVGIGSIEQLGMVKNGKRIFHKRDYHNLLDEKEGEPCKVPEYMAFAFVEKTKIAVRQILIRDVIKVPGAIKWDLEKDVTAMGKRILGPYTEWAFEAN
jgi:hypothetical protein